MACWIVISCVIATVGGLIYKFSEKDKVVAFPMWLLAIVVAILAVGSNLSVILSPEFVALKNLVGLAKP
jgi:hypothetical protein